MSGLLDRLLGLHGVVVYALVAAVVFAEDALFIGFVLPGETAAILGGVAASLGHVSLPAMIAVVVAAAIIGDTAGYEIGRRFGPRLLNSAPLRHRQHRLDRAKDLLRRRGGTAVFLGRFVAFFRAVMPTLAGTAAMPYRRFLLFNAAGGLTWGTGTVIAGYLAGHSYRALEKAIGRGTAITVAVVVVITLVVWRMRRHHRQATEDNTTAP
jgi:membrane protein DedA with SNARE-associated domain